MTTGDDATNRVGAGRLRPALHFAPRRNWMNDPNGLIHWQGRVHLFYQHNPASTAHEHIAWGHASTTDLWNWEDHPLALVPDPRGPDRDGCWSGCAVVHEGWPHLLYTGRRGHAQLPCLAVAADPGLIRWTRHDGNPVIASPPPGERVVEFRDHTVWRSGPAWYQVVGGSLADRGGALFLYRSVDLRAWQYLGVFAAAADHGLDGRVWECPDVFTIGDTAVVIVSLLDDEPRHAMWMTGQISDGRFTPRSSGRCDSGTRYYAPQSLSLADGRRVGVGWLRESLSELRGPDRSRVGVMSLPRELYLDGETLRSRPARELDSARSEKLASRLIETRGALSVQLSARSMTATEIHLTPARGASAPVTLRLRGVACADIEVQVSGDSVVVREGGRLLTSGPGAVHSATLAGEIRLYYDGGILEVYGKSTAPAAVICNRQGVYDRLEAEILARDAAARITAWSCGRSSGAAPAAVVEP